MRVTLVTALLAAVSPNAETGDAGPRAHVARSRVPAGGHPANVVPFTPPRGLRRPSRRDGLPRWFADGGFCSTGCRPAARTGWPLRPFHRQHALRAGINELRTGSMHSGIDIQARDGEAVYAMQSGTATVTEQGFDTNVQVGRFVYFHVNPWVATGQYVLAYSTVVGTVRSPAGHVHVTDQVGRTELNPLRPGGRVVGPWRDTARPVIGLPHIRRDRRVTVEVYDPQSYVVRTTYATPVLAPAAIAWRLRTRRGRRIGPLHWALRGTRVYPFSVRHRVYAPGARGGGYLCFAFHPRCTPTWRYWLAGGLAPRIPRIAPGRYVLTIYAWDWAGNASALDVAFAKGGRPVGRKVPDAPASS
ncbi:MAG: Peptidase family [Solirubrobacteraceae bacterium]|jgi:hypothetical protein|nr:Peptidase family [Solirubrobacteraceae bacterium]